MQKFRISLLLTILMCVFSGISFAHEDVDNAPSCKYCNMDRGKFAHSRMIVEYDDGTTVATCSIHCLAIDLANNINKGPVAIMVGDYNTKQLIDAEKAFWVVGGKQNGVMTKQAKWAFIDKSAAEKFISEHGGAMVDFDQAMKAAYESMYEDTKMIRNKRKMMRMNKAAHK